MRASARRAVLLLIPLVCGLLPLLGCGVAEYEQEMEKTRKRLAYIDEENRLLGEPLPPQDRPPRVFFRPPKEIRAVPSTQIDPALDWLAHYPWADNRAWLAPLEVFVGAQPVGAEKIEEEITADLRRIVPELAELKDGAGGLREEVITRLGDLPDRRRPVKYRRFALQAEEKPTAAVDGPAIPAACVYRYDVYLHDAGDWVIVIVFKQLDRSATEERWRAEREPAALRRLRGLDTEDLPKQRRLSLATLRVGPEADVWFRAMKREQ